MIYYSSYIVTDYNSCTAENIKTTCLFCDGTKKRVPVSGECKCEGGWFDDSSDELCQACHYSW